MNSDWASQNPDRVPSPPVGARPTAAGDPEISAFSSGLRLRDLTHVETPPQVPGYTVHRKLGEGGSATVWLATHEATGRDVALKVIANHRLLPGHVFARFDREWQLAASLQQPHIARVFDHGAVNGLLYFAMEYVDGLRLDHAAERAGWDLPTTVRHFVTLCRAVGAAHERGVIHRDLKFSNIMVRADGVPFILDLGLALDVGTEHSTVTSTGQVVGTVGFMAPEQARGDRAATTTRSDVFALGVMLYRLTTGRMPLGDSADRTAMLERVLRREEVQRPRAVNRRVPPKLEAIILRCLALDPPRRYATGHDLADDLERFLRGERVHARQQGAGYRAWRWCVRRRRGLAAAGLIVLLTVATAAGLWVAGRTREDLAGAHYASGIRNAAQLLEEDRALEARAVLEGLPADRRHWEWRHLYWQTHPPVAQWAVDWPVESLAFDGEVLVVRGEGGRSTTLQLPERARGGPTLPESAPTSTELTEPMQARLSSWGQSAWDEAQLRSAAAGWLCVAVHRGSRVAALHESGRGDYLMPPAFQRDRALALSPDARWIAIARHDNHVTLHAGPRHRARPLAIAVPADSHLLYPAISPDTPLAVSIDRRGTLQSFDLGRGVQTELGPVTDHAFALALDAAERVLVPTVGPPARLMRWRDASPTAVAELPGLCRQLSARGRWAYVPDAEDTTVLADTHSGRSHVLRSRGVCFSLDEQHLLTIAVDARELQLRRWHDDDWLLARSWSVGVPGKRGPLALSGDGRHGALWVQDTRTLFAVESDSGRVRSIHLPQLHAVGDMIVSDDGARAFLLNARIAMVDLKAGRLLVELPSPLGDKAASLSAILQRDQQTLVIASIEGVARLAAEPIDP